MMPTINMVGHHSYIEKCKEHKIPITRFTEYINR